MSLPTMITPSTPTPQHINDDELDEDDEVLQLQPKLMIHLSTFHFDTFNLATVNTAASVLSHPLGVSLFYVLPSLEPSMAAIAIRCHLCTGFFP